MTNYATGILWLIGITGILVLVVYLLVIPSKQETMTGNSVPEKNNTEPFADKTTLVNVGLKLREIPENELPEMAQAPVIEYTKKFFSNKIQKPKKPGNSAFSVRAVPK